MSTEVSPDVVEVTLPDGSVSPVKVYPAADPAARPVVIVWPGFGVGASYFTPLLKELASRGFSAAGGELRGQGANTARASRESRWGYHQLATEDFPLTIRAVKEGLGLPVDHPVILLGHSMGGQVSSVFLARPEAKELAVVGFMGVGAGSPYFRSFTGAPRRRIRIGSAVMSGVSRTLGYWPGKIGGRDVTGYGRQAGPHITEWARLAWRNSFEGLSGADMDYPEAMAQTDTPVLLTRFTNDEDCPLASCEWLAGKFPEDSARVEELAGELGHNRWARKPEIVAGRLEAFVDDIS